MNKLSHHCDISLVGTTQQIVPSDLHSIIKNGILVEFVQLERPLPLFGLKNLSVFQDDLLSSSDRQQIQIRTRTKEKRPKRAQNGNDHDVGAPSGSSWVPWPSRSGNIKREEAVQRLPGTN